MKTSIYVMAHKQFQVPDNPIYIPLQVGKALHEPLGYRGDDSGRNISAKNPYYGELTGLYWAAYNDEESDYMGLCHYRRYFLNQENSLMGKGEYERIFEQSDMILPKANFYPKSYYELYKEAHNAKDLDLIGRILREDFPDYFPVFENIVNSNKVYSSNLFVTERVIFQEYADFLFAVLGKAEAQIDVSSYDSYHKRVFGFLSEQLIYVFAQKKKLRIHETDVGITEEKAETKALKAQMAEMIQQGRPEEAHRIFSETLKERPDVMLAGSDLSGELTDLFLVVYICEQEVNGSRTGMLDFSRDLSILLQHFRLVRRILINILNKTADAEQIQYLKDAKVTKEAVFVIYQATSQLSQSQVAAESFCKFL